MIATFVITPLVTLIWSSGTLVFSPEAGMASFYATFAIVFGLMLVGGIIFFVGRKDEKRS
jgi:hypothetical protein